MLCFQLAVLQTIAAFNFASWSVCQVLFDASSRHREHDSNTRLDPTLCARHAVMLVPGQDDKARFAAILDSG